MKINKHRKVLENYSKDFKLLNSLLEVIKKSLNFKHTFLYEPCLKKQSHDIITFWPGPLYSSLLCVCDRRRESPMRLAMHFLCDKNTIYWFGLKPVMMYSDYLKKSDYVLPYVLTI